MSYKWDLRFLRMAHREVAEWSKDPNKKVGCVLVSPDRRRFAMGYNGLPRDLEDTAVRLENKDRKNQLSVHAELNAILNSRTDLTGWTIYTTSPPCTECAKAIMQASIVRVVCPPISVHSGWYLDHCHAHGILREAGVFFITIQLEDFDQ